jgi:hypothetical protein
MRCSGNWIASPPELAALLLIDISRRVIGITRDVVTPVTNVRGDPHQP